MSEPQLSSCIVPGDQVNRVINVLDSLSKLDKFIFTIDTSVKTDMKKAIYQKRVYGITDQEIDRFFGADESICLDMAMLHDFVDSPEIMDGIGFSFELNFRRIYGDTIYHRFQGNIYDDLKREDIKTWLVFYLSLRDNRIFSDVKILDYYFGNDLLMDVLFKFIVSRRNGR